MIKYLYKCLCGCFLLGSSALLLAACQDDDDKIAIPHPDIDKWEITSATAGDELSLTGENIHLISAVKFGDHEPVVIDPAKRDRTSLTFNVPALPVTDTLLLVAVYNTSKTLVLCEAFVVIVPPVIPAVTGEVPASVKPGDIVTLAGANLNIIKAIYLGDNPVDIRVKNETTLSFAVPDYEFPTTTTLRLVYDNILGPDQSLLVSDRLEIAVPVIIPSVTGEVPVSVSIGETITLTGENLNIIKAVYIGDAEVEIQVKEAGKLTFQTPLLEATTTVAVSLKYDNALGRDQSLTVTDRLEIVVVVPVVSNCPETGESGKDITIIGTDLQLTEKVMFGDREAVIVTRDEVSLKITVPEYAEAVTLDVRLIYRTDKEVVARQGFCVTMPAVSNVYFWPGAVIGGQATGLSLFNATTGEVVSPCDLIHHQLDVDFMMNVTTAGENTISGPRKTTNTLKNQKCDGQSLNVADYSEFMEVVTKFRLLSTTGTQGTIVDLVKAGEITELSDGLFDGISLPSSETPKNFEVGQVYWFKNEQKAKNGLFLVKSVTAGATVPENTLTLDVYYEK